MPIASPEDDRVRSRHSIPPFPGATYARAVERLGRGLDLCLQD